MNILKRIFLPRLLKKEKYPEYYEYVKSLTGAHPKNFEVYLLALRHSSLKKRDKDKTDTNERLEFLGDAILDAILADFLFNKYPFRDEGFLTNIKSRIVNRETLNDLSLKIGLSNFVITDIQNNNGKNNPKSIYGDTFEAFIGALYLDKGFKFSKNFVINKLVIPYFDLKKIVNYDPNFKSQLLQITQSNNLEIKFNTFSLDESQKYSEFKCEILIEGQYYCEGHGPNKKKAEQDAAKKAFEHLKDDPRFINS